MKYSLGNSTDINININNNNNNNLNNNTLNEIFSDFNPYDVNTFLGKPKKKIIFIFSFSEKNIKYRI